MFTEKSTVQVLFIHSAVDFKKASSVLTIFDGYKFFEVEKWLSLVTARKKRRLVHFIILLATPPEEYPHPDSYTTTISYAMSPCMSFSKSLYQGENQVHVHNTCYIDTITGAS